MPDPVVVVPPVVDPALGTPWFTGKVDADTVAHWQNKGYDVNDPVKVSTELTKAYREAESKLGAPASQLIRLPADPVEDQEAMKGVFQRLGMPIDAKDYTFPALADKDGKITNTALESVLRTTAAEAFLPKAAAEKVAAGVSKYLADKDAETALANTANLKVEKDTLAKNWGTNHDANMAVVKGACAQLGITAEQVTALEAVKGYASTMELLRDLGSRMGEDKFIKAPGGGTSIASVDQAKSRLKDLKADTAWTTRYLAGDANAKREMGDLMVIIAGDEQEAR